MTETTKLMSSKWNALDEDGKKPYEDLAAKDKERYQRQQEEFEKTGTFTKEDDGKSKS